MRRPNLWWISLLGIAVLALPACTDSSLDAGDSANVVLQVVDITNPAVKGNVTTGTCTVSGATCLDSSQCDPADPTDTCFIDPTGLLCTITEWSASMLNVAKSELVGDSPFNDVVLQDVTVSYEWVNGFVMDPLTIPLSGTIAPNATRQVTFFPITAEDLSALRSAFPAQTRTANVVLTFRGRVENGDAISRAAGSQLFVDACN